MTDGILRGTEGVKIERSTWTRRRKSWTTSTRKPSATAAGSYHAVVANPPYITVKDKALNQAYREGYPEVCHRQYSLSVPFLQRLFVLACNGGYQPGPYRTFDVYEPKNLPN